MSKLIKIFFSGFFTSPLFLFKGNKKPIKKDNFALEKDEAKLQADYEATIKNK